MQINSLKKITSQLLIVLLMMVTSAIATAGLSYPLDEDIYPFGGTALPLEFAADRGYDYYFQADLLSMLKRRGVMVFHLGHQVSIILPEKSIFHVGTPNIRGNAYETLRLVTAYLRFQPTEVIKVAGYTNKTTHPQQSIALSREQAANIAKMLWHQKLDSPIIYSVGYGQCHLVAVPEDESNRRVEITLRQY